MKILKIITNGFAGLAAVVVLGSSAAVFAQAAPAPTGSKAAVCQGIGLAGGTSDCTTTAGDPDVPGTISRVIGVLSMFVGVAAVIMIIIGGIKYVFSGGDSNSVTSAKNTILYALVGLVVALLAQVIVRFVIGRI